MNQSLSKSELMEVLPALCFYSVNVCRARICLGAREDVSEKS